MKRKIIKAFILFSVLLISIIPVFALDGVKNKGIVDKMQDAYHTILREISSKATEDVTITGIPSYFQTGDTACLTGSQSALTVDDIGSALVSFSMVGHKYNSSVTVSTVNELGAMSEDCMFLWETAASHFGLKLINVSARSQEESDQKSVIKGLIREGYAAIVGLKNISNGKMHYVVVYRYINNSSEEIFYLKNPSKDEAAVLEEYMEGWYIEYVYKLYK